MSRLNSSSLMSGRGCLARGAAITALVLVAASCGDDSDDSINAAGTVRSPTTMPATALPVASDRAAYVTAGNQLCDDFAVKIHGVLPDLDGPPTAEMAAEIMSDLEPVLQEWRDGVAALVPPADLAVDHQTLVDELDDSIAITHAATTEDGAQAGIDAGADGPPLDDPANAAHVLFDHCPAGDPAGDS